MRKVNEDELVRGYIKTCVKAGCPLSEFQVKLLDQIVWENKARNLGRNFKFEGLPETVIELSKSAMEGSTKEELQDIVTKNK